jgi:NADPH-dependent 2,4-dienoyl-CoA reductase/sulfur reductase-like enzyme
MEIVVVGASLAGLRTIQALRRLGVDAAITVVDRQPEIACDRPPLSKTFLADPAALPRPVATPDELGAELLLGQVATDVDLADRSVGLGPRRLHYDTLVIASGSAPRTFPGLEPGPGVHVLRTAAHAAQIRAGLLPGARVVIVGGGFIGAEIAWTARSLGCDVAIVEPLPALMMRGLGPELGAVFSRRHAANGVLLRLGTGVTSVESSRVRLTSGDELAADIVVLGLGTTPEVSWLDGSGLTIRDGVVCDAQLRAAPDVYAVGDIARWLNPRYGELVRVEHWTNAVEQASVAAANIAGTPTVYDAVPYVWSDQLGGRLQIFGRVRAEDELRFVFGSPDEPKFVAVTHRGGVLQSAVGFSAIRELLPYRKQLIEGGVLAA